MRLIVQSDYDNLSKWTAYYIADRILRKAKENPEKPFVLGLPNGASPLGMYQELIQLCKEQKISFKNVITFSMIEYVGLEKEHPYSNYTYMWNHFFKHIDIPQENIHMLNGNALNIEEECQRYENQIKAVGGIDLFIGGIGADGHIACNEPGSSLASRTRKKKLTTDTILATAKYFNNDFNLVPKEAMTVGVGTILDSCQVLILVNGLRKARALRHAVEEGISQMWTVSALQMHAHALIVCDYDACYELKVGTYHYFMDIEKDNLQCELPMHR